MKLSAENKVDGIVLVSTAEFGIGVHEARAVPRAREAEDHWDKYRSERDLRGRIFETSPVGITVVDVDRSLRMVSSYLQL